MSKKNQRWARLAPVLVLSIASLYFPGTGEADRLGLYGLGLAVENLVTQATALGLYVHQAGGFSKECAHKAFDIPEGREPVDVIAIGYLGDPKSLPEDLREQELARRTRKPLAEFVFSGRWGNVSAIVTEIDH